ncbi:MAG: alpha-E domain-containing protein [Gammaproteobacteria bacterium]|nr:alpha-E domain-containing protein [Gammaproteobacteria bacterium]
MLSRVADHLYWMARYTERAENLARMLDVNCRMTLLRSDEDTVRRRWSSTLETVGQLEPFLAARGAVTQAAAIDWLSFERGNPGSIGQCLGLARENAHAVRGTLTSEAWETLNATWLEFRRFRPDAVTTGAPGDFFEWVKFRSHLARGVIQGTMLADDALEFTWLGTYLERADNTARILDARFLLLADDAARADEAGDYYEWSALLRSVSAFEIYRKVYRDLITPRRVAELLVLREAMPRSLRHCMARVHATLERVANDRSAETLRRAGELHAGLQYGRIDDAIARGLREHLSRFLAGTADLGARIADDFLVSEASA